MARAYAQAALDILGQFCAHAFSAFMEIPKITKTDEIISSKGRLLPKQHLLQASSMRVTINPTLKSSLL